MKRKGKRKYVKKGSIDGFMLSDAQMSVLINKSTISAVPKGAHIKKEVKQDGNKNESVGCSAG